MGRGRKKKIDYAKIAKKRSSVLECPDWVSDEVKQVWNHVVPLVAEESDIRGPDFISLLQLTQSIARWIKVNQQIDELDTLVFESPNGALQTHPLLKVQNQCDSTITKIVREFGMNPLSRKKLKGTGERGAPSGRQKFFDFMKKKPARGETIPEPEVKDKEKKSNKESSKESPREPSKESKPKQQ